MTIGASAIGASAIGASATSFFSLSPDDLTTGSPSLDSPAIVCQLGIDSLVKLLLHADGANFGTTIIDSAPTAHTMTAHNGAATSTFSPKFGTASFAFDGVDDYIDTPDSTDFTLGTSDFTIDFWLNTNGAGGGTTRRVCGQSGTNGGGGVDGAWHFTMGAADTIGFNVSNGTGYVAVIGTSGLASGWHHIAGVRTGDVLKLFVDGVQEGGDVAFAATVRDSAGSLTLGRRGDQSAQYFTGLIDEFRLSVGMARWSSGFTPPVRAYGYCCMPSALTTSSPVLDSPGFGFNLVASDLTTGSPDLGTPSLTAFYSLVASSLTTSSPALDSPPLTHRYNVVASDLTTGSPALDAPSVSVFYALAANDLTTGSPILDAPALSVGNQLLVIDLVTGSPALDSPALTVFYSLLAVDLTTGSPVLDAPALFVLLTALDLETGSPEIDVPALGAVYQTLNLTTDAPDLDEPFLSHHYDATALDLETGTPDLGAPVLFIALLALDLETGSPDLEAPAGSAVPMFRPELAIDLCRTLLDPIYASMISNPARLFASTPGLPPIDVSIINHSVGRNVSFGLGVSTLRAAVDVRLHEIALYGYVREDLTNGIVMLWPDTPEQEVWKIDDVLPRPGIWGEGCGELRLFLTDRTS